MKDENEDDVRGPLCWSKCVLRYTMGTQYKVEWSNWFWIVTFHCVISESITPINCCVGPNRFDHQFRTKNSWRFCTIRIIANQTISGNRNRSNFQMKILIFASIFSQNWIDDVWFALGNKEWKEIKQKIIHLFSERENFTIYYFRRMILCSYPSFFSLSLSLQHTRDARSQHRRPFPQSTGNSILLMWMETFCLNPFVYVCLQRAFDLDLFERSVDLLLEIQQCFDNGSHST